MTQLWFMIAWACLPRRGRGGRGACSDMIGGCLPQSAVGGVFGGGGGDWLAADGAGVQSIVLSKVVVQQPAAAPDMRRIPTLMMQRRHVMLLSLCLRAQRCAWHMLAHIWCSALFQKLPSVHLDKCSI
jgi:hypothetical protein